MKEKLLRLIEEAELLRASLEVDQNWLAYDIGEVITDLQWIYNELTKYE